MNLDTAAIIVTYNPNPLEVAMLISRISTHVGVVFIVDNGSRNVAVLRGMPVRLIELGTNKGVAAAQNAGIKAAISFNFKFVILFDQDSLPMPDMVPKLRAAYEHLVMQGVRVAAVGPNYIERNTGMDHHALDGKTRAPMYQYSNIYDAAVRADIVISSGCLICIEALRDVGLMNENLFIDHIDIEWCLRAVLKWREDSSKKIETERCWKIFVAYEATMGHTLGDGVKRFWFIKNRMIPIRSPSRYYYIVRNAVYLIRRECDFPSWWKKSQRRMVIGTLVFAVLGFFPDHYLARIKFVVLGIVHGLIGRLGPIEDPKAQEESLPSILPESPPRR